ncbi:MAG: Gmad2 immunoglobulin-like domain-containing protein [bacterium]|nr:Gmad2 immunoglobulin-like domain-containing protein [bacterium]
MVNTKVLVLCALIAVSALFIFYQSVSYQAVKAPVKALTTVESYSFELIQPEIGNTVARPVFVKGRARGSWFSGGVFPVKVLDENGALIGQGKAKADGTSVNDSFVYFMGYIPASLPANGRAIVVFTAANPSRLPELERELMVRVVLH